MTELNTRSVAEINTRPASDKEFITIADYILDFIIESPFAFSTARYCLMDALGCAFLSLNYPACTQLLGPIIPGTIVPNGARVPGTSYILDPILAAFNIGSMIRWLDFNDTWLAAEWGHPSDNLGAILAVADYVSRRNIANKKPPLIMRDVLNAMIKAYEIQGILALENSFNRVGLDHVILVKIASAAVVIQLLGGTREHIITVLSQVFVDGQSLRTYRHAPNTGSRKSWAAGDATSRAVRLAWLVMQGEQGYPSALSAKIWGFCDVILHHQPLIFSRALGSYVIENILFKISFPAEFHAQTAVECAIQLHPFIINRLNDIDKILLTTQESAIRIINKTGPLYNPADRDHCLQYMVAVGLLYGKLTAECYENTFACDERIDFLRTKMQVCEDTQFTQNYLDPSKRSIGNAVQIFFNDGTHTDKIQIEYPIGHKRRREEGIPLLINKCEENFRTQLSEVRVKHLIDIFLNQDTLENMAVNEWVNLFC
jgi:2-methylcitrate dehydratase